MPLLIRGKDDHGRAGQVRQDRRGQAGRMLERPPRPAAGPRSRTSRNRWAIPGRDPGAWPTPTWAGLWAPSTTSSSSRVSTCSTWSGARDRRLPRRQAGGRGRAASGVDMTPEMLRSARERGAAGLPAGGVREAGAAAGRLRLGRRRHQQLRDQPRARQGGRVPRDRARAEARRPDGHLRHHPGRAAARVDREGRLCLRRLHLGRHAAGRLLRGPRGGGPAGRGAPEGRRLPRGDDAGRPRGHGRVACPQRRGRGGRAGKGPLGDVRARRRDAAASVAARLAAPDPAP